MKCQICGIETLKLLNGMCRSCCYKVYRETHRDEIRKQQKAYYEANKDRIRKQRKAYYETHRDKIRNYHKAYYETNKDKFKAYYETHRDRIRKQKKAYYEARRKGENPETLRPCRDASRDTVAPESESINAK